MKTHTARLMIRVSPELLYAIRQRALTQRRTVSQQVRVAIENDLKPKTVNTEK